MQPDSERRSSQGDDYNPYVHPTGPPSGGATNQPLAGLPASGSPSASSASPTTATSATISLALGLISIPLYCVLMIGIVPALAAIVTGHVALGRIKRSGGTLGGRGLAITGLTTGYLVLLLVVASVALLLPAIRGARDRAALRDDLDAAFGPGDPAAGKFAEARLHDAERKIIGASDGVAHGNSPAAIQLAASFASGMKTMREEFFTKKDKSTISITNGEFITYCQLQSDRCAFVVHVPSYRNFTSEAKEQLAALAWAAAAATVADTLNEEDELGVGLKGTILYGAIMVGEVGGELPDLDGDRDDLLPFFEPAPAQAEPNDSGQPPAEVEQPLPGADPQIDPSLPQPVPNDQPAPP